MPSSTRLVDLVQRNKFFHGWEEVYLPVGCKTRYVGILLHLFQVSINLVHLRTEANKCKVIKVLQSHALNVEV